MSSFLKWWHARSKKAQWAIAIATVAVFLGIVGSLGSSGDSHKKEASTPPPPAQKDAPPPPAAEKSPPPPPPPPPPPAAAKPSGDTGRMSDSEYDEFRNAEEGVRHESEQWADGIQKCAVIGQSGDLAEFSRCVDEAWSGFTTKAQYAYYIAGTLVDDTDKKCRANLRSYRTVLANYDVTLDVAHKYASNLQFDAMTLAFKQMAPATRRYVKFTLNALSACEPR